MSIRQIYLRSGLFSLGGKLITSFAALGVIWLITRIAGKEVFGEIMIAYAFNFVVSATIAAQFQTVLMYHVSRDHEKNEHRDRLGAALFYSLMIGLAFVFLEKMLATPLASLMHKENLAIWFSSLSWMVPAYAINSILASWYRAKHDVPTMVMHFEVWPNIFRMIFLCVILIILKNPIWITTAYTASYVASFLMLYTRNPVPLNANFLFTKWDMTYSTQMMAGQMMSKSLSNIVVFFLGIFSTTAVVADYSLAMKFAQFLGFPRLIMGQVQMPRMGTQIENRQTAAMMEELEAVRCLTLAATTLGTAFFLLILPYIFTWFGDFSGAYPLFIWLALSAIIFAGFGSAANYLGIAGHSAAAMTVHATAFLTLLISTLILIPLYGGNGAAIATVISTIALMASTTFAVFHKDKFNTITVSSILQIAASSLAIILAAANIISGPTAALILIGVAALGFAESRPALRLLLPF